MMTSHLAIIALGANLGEPRATFAKALAALAERGGELLARSSWHETEPLLHPDSPVLGQNRYLNGVVLLRTALDPEELFQVLQQIENDLGRARQDAIRWGPRIIDLDLIDFDGMVLTSPNLVLPHPEMHKRSFVLDPLAEVAPEWIHPVLKKSVSELRRGIIARAA